MYMMFGTRAHSSSPFTQDISNWDISSVTDMSYMFNTTNFRDAGIRKWIVRPDTKTTSMFYRTAFATVFVCPGGFNGPPSECYAKPFDTNVHFNQALTQCFVDRRWKLRMCNNDMWWLRRTYFAMEHFRITYMRTHSG